MDLNSIANYNIFTFAASQKEEGAYDFPLYLENWISALPLAYTNAVSSNQRTATTAARMFKSDDRPRPTDEQNHGSCTKAPT
ncbi:hypothetical protein ALQ88_02360 [Pseudomonas savastanoi]|nr:hypothetical protein ALQ88_02360 [Pseudomonas savastanoi]